jgi:hypothetical protein
MKDDYRVQKQGDQYSISRASKKEFPALTDKKGLEKFFESVDENNKKAKPDSITKLIVDAATTEPKLPPIPLTSGKNLTPSQKKQSRTADQVAIDRTKNDVGNATKRINTLDDSIKKFKAGKGVMSEGDLRKVASLERSKSEWVVKRTEHKAKLDKQTKGEPVPRFELKSNQVMNRKGEITTHHYLVNNQGQTVDKNTLKPYKGFDRGRYATYSKTEAESLLTKANKDYPDLAPKKRKDSFDDSDRILTYITDNSGNMMGICQINGIKYRFLKPVFSGTVLTPIADTNLGYLFDMAPDLSLPRSTPETNFASLFDMPPSLIYVTTHIKTT